MIQNTCQLISQLATKISVLQATALARMLLPPSLYNCLDCIEAVFIF
jgi:hypothetical protein